MAPPGRMKLSVLLATVAPLSFDEDEETRTWAGLEAAMAADRIENQLIGDLVAELVRDGDFREPIVILKEEQGPTVVNGLHRVVAAKAFGLADIGYVEAYPEVDQPTYIVDLVGAEPFNDDDIWAYRSLKVADDFWVEADLMTGGFNSNTLRIYYYVCDGSRMGEVIGAVARLALAQGHHAIKLSYEESVDEDD